MLPATSPSGARRVRLDAGYALLAAAVAAASLYALSATRGTAGASDAVVVAAPSASPRPVTSLWFGDGVTAGCCRSDPASAGMAEVAARRLGWAVPQVVGEAGTGFLTAAEADGVRTGPFPERIQAAVEDSYYDVVVVAGGNEDAGDGFDAGAFRAAVRTVLAQVRTSLPDAELVVLSAYSPDGRGLDELRGIQREESERVGAVFVDQVASGWMRGRPDLLHTDRFHPDDAGQVLLGARAASALREALPPPLVRDGTADDA